MAKVKASGMNIKEAVDKFGSLQKAVDVLQKENAALKKDNTHLKQENVRLKAEIDGKTSDSASCDDVLRNQRGKIKFQAERIGEHEHQYRLFEGFLAMLADSPSITSPIQALIDAITVLTTSKWHTSKNAAELRSLFICATMGEYLKCFHCSKCKASFIVNKEPHYKHAYNYFQCPACHSSSSVEGDDSFLRAMVSETQLENVHFLEEYKKENDALRPLKVFLDLPCEVCGKPVTEWTKRNVEMGANGSGWGHTQCWQSSNGQVRLYAKAVRDELQSRVRKL
ncbi:hypothetical protein ACFLWV_03000 [Chloroflexota bacterium]